MGKLSFAEKRKLAEEAKTGIPKKVSVPVPKTSKQVSKKISTSSKKKKEYDNVKVLLCLMEKNEEHILAKSSLPCAAFFVDHYCIDDTGSDDRSKEIITEFFAERNIPGRIYDTPWTKKFNLNRTSNLDNAMEYLSEIVDDRTLWYMYFMDSDDLILGGNIEDFRYMPGTQIEAPAYKHIAKPEDGMPGNYPGFKLDRELLLREQPDLVFVDMNNEEVTYPRASFARYDPELLFHYKGVCHESIEPRKESKIRHPKMLTLEGGYYVGRSLGARSLNPLKYIIDAEVMIEELDVEEDPGWISRYYYYIAQSFMSSRKAKIPGENGDKEHTVYDPCWYMREAEKWFMKRANINNQDSDERYLAYLFAAQNKKWIYESAYVRVPFECDERLFKASYIVKDRLEAMTELIAINNERKDYLQSWRLAVGVIKTIKLTPLTHTLFIERNIYNYRFRDAAAHAALGIGFKEEAKELWEQILNLPPNRLCSVARYKCIYENLRLCLV